MISQAGIYKLTLYENKGFSFLYDVDGNITLSSISNTGETYEFETVDNPITFENKLEPASNNEVINDYSLSVKIDGLIQANLDILEKIQSSIYGWIPVIEFMDNQVKLINTSFFEKVGPVNIQVSHTFNIDLKPRTFTFERLKNIVDSGSTITGLLNFDGIDDKVEYILHPDVTGSKIITINAYFKTYGVTQAEDMVVFGVNNSDYFDLTYITNVERLRVAVSISGGSIDYDISSYMNIKVVLVLIKTVGAITSFTINGDIPPIFSTGSGNSAASISSIGHHPDVAVFKYLQNAYIWGITINSTFQADGQPAGNLAPAWSQSIAATVHGSPTIIDLP